MGLKIILEWYDVDTELCEGEESSTDLGEDSSVMDAIGIASADNVNNGGFDVKSDWIPTLQPFFVHPINPVVYIYQVAFEYRDVE
ncbi:cloacin [Pseudomonas sp. ANT_H14]|nr:cloacin [Pseudomonas sp. ANT_H4]KAA0944494.1 cloacin [Pseudomonas sp. ANT_H14]